MEQPRYPLNRGAGWAPETVWKFSGSKRRLTLLAEEPWVTQSVAQ